MDKNTRKDKINAIRILQQTYCAESVSSIKILNNLSDEDINELYTNWIEYKIKIKKLMRILKNKDLVI
jgi:accessory colonization factor AcfC